MKHQIGIRSVAVCLVLCLLVSLFPGVTAAAGDQATAKFYEVQAPENSAVPRQQLEAPARENSPAYADTDEVRVVIVLEEPSVLEKGYSTQDLGANAAAMAYSDAIRDTQVNLAGQISANALDGEDLDVAWNLTVAANLISATVPYGSIEEISAVPGVEAVYLEPSYTVPEEQQEQVVEPNMSTAVEMTGTGNVWAAGYTGAGSRIAIIDTGIAPDHQSFNEAAWIYALAKSAEFAGQPLESYMETLDLLDVAELRSVLGRLHVAENNPEFTAEDLYISGKLPFGYNYAEKSLSITHEDGVSEHGSHVAGIAGANRYVPTDEGYANAAEAVYVVGQAPDAQILTMRTFNHSGVCYASDYLAAIEDALILGCDAVNLSLGSGGPGYTIYGEEYFDGVLSALAESDTVVSISAGNSYSWSTACTAGAPGYNYVDDPNLDMVGSPGSMANAFTVASVENTHRVTPYLKAGDELIFYGELLYSNAPLRTLDPQEAGTELPFLLLEADITQEEFDALDLTGKVVFFSRSTSNLFTYFADGHQMVQDRGGIAFGLYNSQAGTIYMDLSASVATIPAFTVTLADSEALRAVATQDSDMVWSGVITLYGASNPVDLGQTGYVMSDFSSWGVPGDLSLKPEITAPGGQIYSVNGAPGAQEPYELMSGTSMAAPQIAGMSATLAQYIRETGLAEKTGISPRHLIQNLLMSTATPMVEEASGNYYSMLKQGAGLANVAQAMSAAAYVQVEGQADGKVKAELGDDPERTGEYQVNFSLRNLTGEPQAYLLSGVALTQDYFTSYANSEAAAAEDESRQANYLAYTTTPLDATFTLTAGGSGVQLKHTIAQCDFDGSGNVDEADGQALLDYVTGVRESIACADYADLSGDGETDTYDVHLFLAELQGQTVVVPASGTVEVSVTIALTDAQKAALDEIYVDGAYVECYLSLEAISSPEGLLSASLSIPVLAFYGSWTDSSMFDRQGAPENYNDPNNRLEESYIFSYANYVYFFSMRYASDSVFGGNPYLPDEAYLPERNAISTEVGNYISGIGFLPIRNAVDGRIFIENVDTGEVYRENNIGAVEAAYYYVNGGYWSIPATEYYLRWRCQDANGKQLPEGTQFQVGVELAPEYYLKADGTVDWDSTGPGSRYVTPFTIDNTAPQILAVSTENLAEDKLQVTVQDNRYVAAVCLMNASGEKFITAVSPNQTELGATTTMEIDLSGFAGNTFMLMVGDYGENETYYRLELEGRPTRVNTDTFRGYNYPGNWTSFNVGVNQDEYILAADGSSYNMVAYADGHVFAAGTSGVYIYPEEDNFEHRILVGTSNHLGTSMTFDPETDSLYECRYRPWALFKVDLYTGQATNVGTFTCDGSTVMMRYITYTENGRYYGIDTYGSFYTFRLENDAPVEVTLIGSTGMPSTAFSGPRGMCWDKENDRLYFASAGCLWELDVETGQGTQVGTLSSYNYRGLYIPDYDPAEDPGPHWYDPVDQVASMTLSATSASLLTGESVEVTATLMPWNLSDDSVTWTTSDPAVATVEDGRITGIGAGTATVTAAPALAPELAQTVSVTVTNANVTVEGVLSDSSDVVRLFTWDLAGSGRWTANAATTLEGITAAVLDNDGQLWVQENAEGYRMHRIDPASGAVLETSPMQSNDLAFNDITASSQYGGVFSVRGAAIYPWQLGENATGSYLDFSTYLAAYSGSTQFVGIASAGYYAYEYGTVHADTERLFLLDSASYLWTIYVEKTETAYRCYVPIPRQVTGMEAVRYWSLDGQVSNSLVYNAGTQSLTLAHYDGESTELYLIRPVADGWQGFCVGKTAPGEAPMALASGSFNAASGTDLAVLPAQEEPAVVLECAPAPKADGAVNAVGAAGMAQVSPEIFATQPVTVDRENRTVTITVEAQQAVTNGLLDIAYDAQILTLDEVRSTVQLTAVNRQAGMLNFGYAAAQAVAQGAGLLNLTFTYAESPTLSETQVTVTTREENQTAPGTTATLTVDFRCSGGEDCPSRAFADLSTDAWYHPYADYVIAKGLMNGMGGGIFAPDLELTRGMMVTTLYRLAGEPEVLEPATFTDVKVGQYFAKAVAWAEDAGITNGVTGNLFAPNREVTREQAATFLYRFVTEYLGQTPGQGADLIGFRDGNEVSGYASTAMAWAVAEGLFQGYPDGSLQPKAALRRIQLAKLLTVLATEF